MTIAVLGAGAAGLGAAYELARRGRDAVVLEAGAEVGGLARSFDLWGQRVEFGAHLLVRTDGRIDALWDELVGDEYDAVDRERRSCCAGGGFGTRSAPLPTA